MLQAGNADAGALILSAWQAVVGLVNAALAPFFVFSGAPLLTFLFWATLSLLAYALVVKAPRQ